MVEILNGLPGKIRTVTAEDTMRGSEHNTAWTPGVKRQSSKTIAGKPKLRFATMAGYCIPILCLLLITSCSQKITFITSRGVPSAQGHIKVGKDDNNNHTIDITVERLADPSRLTPSKKTYVVWMETESNGTKNIGQLNSSDSFFSSTMKASLHAVTPFKPTKVFITAEDNANIQHSGSLVVLTTKSFN